MLNLETIVFIFVCVLRTLVHKLFFCVCVNFSCFIESVSFLIMDRDLDNLNGLLDMLSQQQQNTEYVPLVEERAPEIVDFDYLLQLDEM